MNTKERVRELTDRLETGLKTVWSSEHFLRYLKAVSQFHNYSLLNCMLIYLQAPSATYVAGYSTWQTKFKRHVKKGEKGIKILAPCPYTMTETNENGIETYNERVTFRPAVVYDILQTDGEPLPAICEPLAKDLDAYPILLAIVITLTDAEIRIQPSHVRGYYRPADHVIVIDEKLSDANRIKTIVHEVAHSVLHSETGPEHDADRQTQEIQAESIAFVICQHLGIDSTHYSTEYIASWAHEKSNDVLKQNLKIIQSTAADFISQIDVLLRAYHSENECPLTA